MGKIACSLWVIYYNNKSHMPWTSNTVTMSNEDTTAGQKQTHTTNRNKNEIKKKPAKQRGREIDSGALR